MPTVPMMRFVVNGAEIDRRVTVAERFKPRLL